jgi:hypothetical protein
MLTGAYADDKLGKITTAAYVDIAPPTWIPDVTAVFDSISLILNYDGYYYGDTTQVQKLVVRELSHVLTGRIRKDPYIYNDIPYSYFYQEGGLYNTSVTSVYPEVLGSVVYHPRPTLKDSLRIRLKDKLGSTWLEMAKNSNDTIVTQALFNEYFRGFKIDHEGASSAVVGFNSATLRIRIYYREIVTEGVYKNTKVDFLIYNSALQYNQIHADRSGTLLANMPSSKPIASSLTGNESFIQSGAGVLTKIEFPYLSKIYENNPNLIITQARLEIVPIVDASSDEKKLPSVIGMYYTNQSNIPMGALTNDSDATKAQTASLVTRGEFESKASYSFPMTNYISNRLKKNSVTPYELMIGTPTADFLKGITRMKIGNENNADSNIKLKLYYTSYNK